MLLEEELKSIDELIMLKHFLETEEKYEGQEREVNAIKIVLNLINKLQKENENQKENYKNLILNVSKIAMELGLEEDGTIDEIYAKIREKDKQIDLMAEHIVSSAIVDDTVCAIKCDCESDILEDCSHEKMLNCTKEYFKRKATNIG